MAARKKPDPLLGVDDEAAIRALMAESLQLSRDARELGEYSAANAALRTYAAARERWREMKAPAEKSTLARIRGEVDELEAKRAGRQSGANKSGRSAGGRSRSG